MGVLRALRAVAFAGVSTAVACGVTSGEPIKPPVAAQTCDANACGPLPAQPNYKCPNGSLGGPTGRCILNQDGTCGWEIVACPASDAGPDGAADAGCTTTECGPRPLVASMACDGGAMSGEECVESNGQCVWVYVPCP